MYIEFNHNTFRAGTCHNHSIFYSQLVLFRLMEMKVPNINDIKILVPFFLGFLCQQKIIIIFARQRQIFGDIVTKKRSIYWGKNDDKMAKDNILSSVNLSFGSN